MKNLRMWTQRGVLLLLGVACILLAKRCGVMSDIANGNVDTVINVILCSLTYVYVFINSEQLCMMNRQLDKMQEDNAFRDYALPIIKNAKLQIEVPKLFFSPEGHGINTRYILTFDVDNISLHPALFLDIEASLLVNKNEIKSLVSERLNHLIHDKTRGCSFLLHDDNNVLFKEISMQNHIKNFYVTLSIIFKNPQMGSCLISLRFHVSQKDIIKKDIIDWYSKMEQANISMADNINTLNRLFKFGKPDYGDVLQKTQDAFLNMLSTKSNITLTLFEDPTALKMCKISEKEYKKLTNNRFYGRFIG